MHRIRAMFLEPFIKIEPEILFGPKHSRQSLAHNASRIVADAVRSNGSVEFVRIPPARLHYFSERFSERLADREWRLVA
jgi:hypothetical protein